MSHFNLKCGEKKTACWAGPLLCVCVHVSIIVLQTRDFFLPNIDGRRLCLGKYGKHWILKRTFSLFHFFFFFFRFFHSRKEDVETVVKNHFYQMTIFFLFLPFFMW